MKFESIVKKLIREGYTVEPGEFSFQMCKKVSGTCLVDVVDGIVVETTAKYTDVLQQIADGKSHIQTIDTIKGCKKKTLTPYHYMGYKGQEYVLG